MPILRIFCPVMIFSKALCFKDTGRTRFVICDNQDKITFKFLQRKQISLEYW